MEEETIDVEVNLGKELADKFNKMTKKELLNRLAVSILRNRVQDDTVAELEHELNKAGDNMSQERRLHKATLMKLDIAESYVAQGRAMIDAAMDRWDEYDI